MMLAPDYLDEFDPPPKHELDSHRESRDREYGERAWTIAELRRIIAEAGRLGEYRRAKSGRKLPPRNPHLHAQILLALFGAFGSDDLSAMPKISVDLKTGLIRFPRVKIKGRPRACFIPRRVVDAIYSSLAHRRGDGNLLFATMAGQKCNAAKVRSDELGPLTASRNDTIGKNFSRMVRRIGLAKKRTGFKTLRAMCRTMMLGADIDPDLIAVIMGRKLRFPIDEFYLRGEMREKLMKVARHIERQLFSKSKRVG
jgi:integrase